MTTTATTNELLEAALEYAGQGWNVLALHTVRDGRCSCGKPGCDSIGKHPRLPNGESDATKNPDAIRKWWAQWPDANVGIATKGSAIFVVDLDVKKGKDGVSVFADWERRYSKPPETVSVRTGSGGAHLYFRRPSDGLPLPSVNDNRNIGRGVDVRVDTGYVVAPPSNHVSGELYRWEHSPADCDVAKAPDWLLRVIRNKGHEQPGGNGVHKQPAGGGKLLNELSTEVVDRIRSLLDEMPLKKEDWADRSEFDYSLVRELYRDEGASAEAAWEVVRGRSKFASGGRRYFDTTWKNVVKYVREAREKEQRRAKASKANTSGSAPAPKTTGRKKFAMTDLGNAQRLVHHYGRDIRYCGSFGWLVWDKQRFEVDRTGAIMRKAKQTMRGIYNEASAEAEDDRRTKLAKWGAASESSGRLTATVSLAESEPGVPVVSEDLDADPWALNCLNGTLNLKDGTFGPHSQADLCTKLTNVAYHKDATCPRWEQFLSEIMAGDQQLIDFLQRAVGHSLTGDTSERCVFLMHGSGKNGKSTFLWAIRELLGDGYAIHARAETILAKRTDAIPCDLARLKGCRFLTVTEIEQGHRLDVARVKEMSGGTDPITARFMRCDEFTFMPTFKLWVGTNHKPTIRDHTDSIWDRLFMIPFAVRFEKPDKQLPAKLRSELPGILAWSVRGCLEWQRLGGLYPPEAVTKATADYRKNEDVFGQWADEACEFDEVLDAGGKLALGDDGKPTTTIEAISSAVYASYKDWCEANGERPLSQKWLAERLKAKGCKRDRRNAGRFWLGIQLLNVASDTHRGGAHDA